MRLGCGVTMRCYIWGRIRLCCDARRKGGVVRSHGGDVLSRSLEYYYYSFFDSQVDWLVVEDLGRDNNNQWGFTRATYSLAVTGQSAFAVTSSFEERRRC